MVHSVWESMYSVGDTWSARGMCGSVRRMLLRSCGLHGEAIVLLALVAHPDVRHDGEVDDQAARHGHEHRPEVDLMTDKVRENDM